REVCDREDALASTRDACATQNAPPPLDSRGTSTRARDRSMNLGHATLCPPSRDLAKTRRPGRCSPHFLSAMQPDNGNRQNRFLVADNSGTAPASIPFRETG